MKINGVDISKWRVLIELDGGMKVKIRFGELKEILEEITAKTETSEASK